MWTKFKWWIVQRLGGEVRTNVPVPVYRPVKKMLQEDYIILSKMFENYPILFTYFHHLADTYEYELASMPYEEKHDRERIAAQAKLLVMKDLLHLPEKATQMLNDIEKNIDKKGKVLNNIGD